MPSGLDIDREWDMNGLVRQYSHHVVIRTGRDGWKENIEDEEVEEMTAGPNFARSLHGLVGKGGKFHNPSRPILITNCSLDPGSGTWAASDHNASYVHVFPANVYVSVPNTPAAHESFVQQFLNWKTAFADETELKHHEFDFAKGEVYDDTASSVAEPDSFDYLGSVKLKYRTNNTPMILICGHNDRDIRCGTLGPILHKEFSKQIGSRIRGALPIHLRHSLDKRGATAASNSPLKHTRVALTSCVSGHAFAGNVVIYLPPGWVAKYGNDSLGGKGIWYGRVEPKHVAGIIYATLMGGKIIEELLRGIFSPRTWEPWPEKWEPRAEMLTGA